MPELFQYNKRFVLESGIVLPQYHLAYTTHGQLNETKDNVVWVFHALTANSDASEWWPGLVGKGKLLDSDKFFIVCANVPGSCYGSLGPLDINPETKQPYYHDFPFFTTRDMIRAYQPLKDFLGIKKIHIGIGGSMGGQQLLEWAIEEPLLFEFIFPIATNALHSPWGIAFNTTQRMCIEADNSWKQKNKLAGIEGMKAARAIGLLSYRNYYAYYKSQPRSDSFPFGESWDGAASYQRYQGEKLAKRFNAFSYYKLSQSMDSHNVGRGRESVEGALKEIRAKTLVIGIETDILFPLIEQEILAINIQQAKYEVIYSLFGHDGFLLEFQQMERIINDFLVSEKNKQSLNSTDTVYAKPAS